MPVSLKMVVSGNQGLLSFGDLGFKVPLSISKQ